MLPCSDAHLPARSSRELSAVCMSLTSTGPLVRSTSLQACRAQDLCHGTSQTVLKQKISHSNPFLERNSAPLILIGFSDATN